MANMRKTTASSKKRGTSVKKARTSRKPAGRATSKSRSRSAAASNQSFKIVSSDTPFFTFSVTKQSVYWLVFMAAVLALGLWILYLQTRINEIYDQIDQTTQSQQAGLSAADLKALRHSHN